MRNNEEYLFNWAKQNRKELCKKFFAEKDIKKWQKIALFMAWSPGAGKTEFIRRLLLIDEKALYYTLDLDLIRWWMPNYNWKNAEQYTRGAIKILEKLIDECLDNEYPFVLDWTFTSTPVMDRNLERLIKKEYKIHVFYIHTLAELAWLYTLYRWKEEGRCIPVDRFINDYLVAPENVCAFSEKYEWLLVYIVNKIYDGNGIGYKIFPFPDDMSIHQFFDKTTFIDYNIKRKVSRFKFYRFISLIPFIWKNWLKKIIKKKEASLSEMF